jgi:hypothetical protein
MLTGRFFILARWPDLFYYFSIFSKNPGLGAGRRSISLS